MSETVGAVKALWRFPVKSMRGEEVELVDLTERGLVGGPRLRARRHWDGQGDKRQDATAGTEAARLPGGVH